MPVLKERKKTSLPFTRTLARDQREHPHLDHQSVRLFSQIWLYLILQSLQLELGGHTQWKLSNNREHFKNSLTA